MNTIAMTKFRRGGRPKGSLSFDSVGAECLGKVVRHLREAKEVSQEHCAALADIERTYFSKIERGLCNPSIMQVLKIAKALDMPAVDLVGHFVAALAQHESEASSASANTRP